MSSIIIKVPRCESVWSVLPSGSWFSSGKKLIFADTVSKLSSSSVPTSNSASIRMSSSLVSSQSLIFSKIQERPLVKNSSVVFPIISVDLIFNIFNPALLHVIILPSSLIVITAFDILVSILWLYARSLATSSNNLAFSRAIATCWVNAFSRDSSSSVKPPPFLFNAWVQPMHFPSLLMIGTHSIDLVK